MRIRLQVLLPLAVGVIVAVGFLVVSLFVGGAVRSALTTIPGLTADRAVESGVRVVALTGTIVTLVAVAVSALIARLVVTPLSRMREAAEHLAEEGTDPEQNTPVAEIQDVARGMSRAADEIRGRHGREVRERSELARLVETVSEGIMQVDGEARVTRANRASRALLRLPDDAVGRPAGTVLRSAELRRFVEAGAEGSGTDAAEVMVDERRILVSVTPQAEGGAVVTLVDLTDLRRLEEVRRDFVANASHELKTPLTSIRGYTETLLGGGLPESEEKQFLATISRNADRLQRIVDDLLDLSRLEAGRWEPNLETMDLIKAAEACWLSFADRAADQGVTFDLEAATDARARADRRAVEQVFSNLYDNALRYTGDGGRIQVSARLLEQAPGDGAAPRTAPGPGARTPEVSNGPWLVVEVADTGSGIPRDALPRIFERFYRVDPARSRAEGGTGLGLSIVRHLLESMDGGVDVRSELGKGTILRIWLPAVS